MRGQSPLLLPAHQCVKCGSSEPGGALHSDVLAYVSPIVWLTFLISGLITIIAYLLTRKPIQVQYYLCPKCEDRRKVAATTTSLVGIASVLGMVASLAGGPFEVFLGAFFIALFARILFVRPPLRAIAHDDGVFSLRGASPRFLQAIERKQLERF